MTSPDVARLCDCAAWITAQARARAGTEQCETHQREADQERDGQQPFMRKLFSRLRAHRRAAIGQVGAAVASCTQRVSPYLATARNRHRDDRPGDAERERDRHGRGLGQRGRDGVGRRRRRERRDRSTMISARPESPQSRPRQSSACRRSRPASHHSAPDIVSMPGAGRRWLSRWFARRLRGLAA